MITLRHGPRLEDRFTMISNDVFQRADLSFRAKAIYGYLMSCRSGWQLTRDRIAEALEVSAGTIRRALEELEDAGYLVRSQSKGPDGRFNAVEYTIFSEPVPGSRVPRKAGKPADTVCTNLSNGDEQQKQGEVAGGTVCTNLSNGDEQQEGTVSAGQTECANLTPLIRTIKTKKNPPKPPTGVSAPKGGDEPTGELAVIEPSTPVVPAKAATVSSRGCFLPEGWEPDRQVIDAMQTEFPHLNLWQEHLVFVDYWRGVSGARGRKRDWNATWRNWIRKAGKQSSRYSSGHHGGTRVGLQGADARAATLVQMMNEITAENGL
ncbi:helix-turn-helix domain-containing protein [Corynebacterium ulcerans]|uniref:helix-turn-helix domain-containing protein n=1 Tax=Corynebacterium ulcerans TaxID=65058 RepID=UPI0002D2C626|nr:helix-turn-helix domain-containing protein [Corynebacterium ulcerans]BBJ71364.1 hypothetical protein CULC0211_04980 [Corynebacterium ulcerans]GJJ33037.1 hypothetical protein CULCOIPH001_02450 [Corynebacterium ulcerans]GJJ35725.1 hypothetical protein CULCOIPH002_06370 [Corynebacterium ulcerans]